MPEHPSSAPPGSVETELWRGHTSQWVHFWFYLMCLALAALIVYLTWTYRMQYGALPAVALVVPLLMVVIRAWVTRATSYELTSQRLRIHTGLLNRRLEEIELYRVKDYVMDRPLALRMLGLGNVALVTSDPTARRIELLAIPRVEAVREQIRAAVQSERDRKRVRELDLDDPSGTIG